MSTLKEAVGIAPAFDSKTSLAVVSQIHPFSNKSSSLTAHCSCYNNGTTPLQARGWRCITRSTFS